jgi:peptidoglycan/LPS O-acetylase OafA/YrhL
VRLLLAVVLVVALLVVNAAVCGALSGPFARYQARMVWLFPMAAGLLVAGLRPRRRPTPATALDAQAPRL